ncbi:MAG: alkylhydroperoxidase-related (seleno)protein, partial [Lysobacterales bacterium]
TKSWLEECEEAGLSDGQYVELLGIVVTVISIDGFYRAMGFPLEPLPEPIEGEPSSYRPDAKDHGAWVATVSPADLSEHEADLYGGLTQVGNVITAMSLVPDSVRMLKRLSQVQYLEIQDVPNPACNGGRVISRRQMELLAGRVSSLSECFY